MEKEKKYLPLIIIAIVSLLTFVFLAMPIAIIKDPITNTITGPSAYEYNENIKPNIPELKRQISYLKDFPFAAADVNIAKASIKIYYDNIAVMVLAALCLAVSSAGIVIGVKNKGGKRLFFGITVTAIVLTFGIFICGCISVSNLEIIKTLSDSGLKTTLLSPVLVLVLGLISTIGCSILVALNNKKN